MDRIGLFDWLLPEIGDLHEVVQGPGPPSRRLRPHHGSGRRDPQNRIHLEVFTGERAPEVSAYLSTAGRRYCGAALRLGALFHGAPNRKPEARRAASSPSAATTGRAEQIDSRFRSLRASRKLSSCIADLTRHHLILGFLVNQMPLDKRRVFASPRPHRIRSLIDVTLLTVADRLAAGARPRSPARRWSRSPRTGPGDGHCHALDWDRNGPPAQFLPSNRLAEALEALSQARSSRSHTKKNGCRPFCR